MSDKKQNNDTKPYQSSVTFITIWEEKEVLCKNVLEEAVKINLIESWPLNTRLFNI